MASSPDVAAALSAVNAHDMPVHVQMRLAALSGDETITYLDAHQSSTIGGSRTTSGEVVAFTPRLVLQAVFQNSQARLDNPDANSQGQVLEPPDTDDAEHRPGCGGPPQYRRGMGR